MTNSKPKKLSGKVSNIRKLTSNRFSPYHENEDSFQNDFFQSSHNGDSSNEGFILFNSRSDLSRKFNENSNLNQGRDELSSGSSSSNTTNFYAALDQQRSQGYSHTSHTPSQLNISSVSSHNDLHHLKNLPSQQNSNPIGFGGHPFDVTSSINSNSGLSNHGISSFSQFGSNHSNSSSNHSTHAHSFSSLLNQNSNPQDHTQYIDTRNYSKENTAQSNDNYQSSSISNQYLDASDKLSNRPNFLNQTRSSKNIAFSQSPQSAESSHSSNSVQSASQVDSISINNIVQNISQFDQISKFSNQDTFNLQNNNQSPIKNLNNFPVVISQNSQGNSSHTSMSSNSGNSCNSAGSNVSNSSLGKIKFINNEQKSDILNHISLNPIMKLTNNEASNNNDKSNLISSHQFIPSIRTGHFSGQMNVSSQNTNFGPSFTNPQDALSQNKTIGNRMSAPQISQFGAQKELNNANIDNNIVSHSSQITNQYSNQFNQQNAQQFQGNPHWSNALKNNQFNNMTSNISDQNPLQIQGTNIMNFSNQILNSQHVPSSNASNNLISLGLQGSNMNYNTGNNQFSTQFLGINNYTHPTIQPNYNNNSSKHGVVQHNSLQMDQNISIMDSRGRDHSIVQSTINDLINESIQTLEKLNSNLNYITKHIDKVEINISDHEKIYDNLLPSVVEQFMSFFESKKKEDKIESLAPSLEVDLRHRKINKVVAHSSVYKNNDTGEYLVTRNRPISICVTYPINIEVDRNSIEWQVYEPMTGRVSARDIVFNDEFHRIEYTIMLGKKRSNVKMKIKLRDTTGKIYETEFNVPVVSYCDATFRKKVNSFANGEYERKCDEVDVK